MRRERTRERTGRELRVSSSDPLNLSGILGSGPRVAARPGRWLILRDGWPVAFEEGGARTDLVAESSFDDAPLRASHAELIDQ